MSADVAELLDRSDERDLYTARIGQAYREGWEAGHVAGVGDGRQAEASERDEAWNRIARPIARGGQAHADLERIRWSVRGEPRARQAFGQSHGQDHPGGPVPAW